jgi:hypothetical protein
MIVKMSGQISSYGGSIVTIAVSGKAAGRDVSGEIKLLAWPPETLRGVKLQQLITVTLDLDPKGSTSVLVIKPVAIVENLRPMWLNDWRRV